MAKSIQRVDSRARGTNERGDSWARIWHFFISVYKMNVKIVRRWHHQLTHLHIHTVSQEMFQSTNLQNSQNFITSLKIFQPKKSGFQLFCSENFTLYSQIKYRSWCHKICPKISIRGTIVFLFLHWSMSSLSLKGKEKRKWKSGTLQINSLMWNKDITGGSYFINCREWFFCFWNKIILSHLSTNAGKFVSAQVILK